MIIVDATEIEISLANLIGVKAAQDYLFKKWPFSDQKMPISAETKGGQESNWNFRFGWGQLNHGVNTPFLF